MKMRFSGLATQGCDLAPHIICMSLKFCDISLRETLIVLDGIYSMLCPYVLHSFQLKKGKMAERDPGTRLELSMH